MNEFIDARRSTGRPCRIIPPYLLEALAASGDTEQARHARRALDADRRFRTAARGVRAGAATAPVPRGHGAPQRVISDAHDTETLPGSRVRGEGEPVVADPEANEAYDGLGATWQLYWQAFGRDSLDDAGLPLLASVHYGQRYDNAFWDGSQMVFGDGDQVVFGRFTASVDVIGHELTHGVTEHTAGLTYSGQSGALNESVSDVFGSMVKQHGRGETVDRADWLIGADLLMPGINGRALRDMLHPGTAYDDPQLGKDPQPADMSGYVDTAEDDGGVHTNSGIPNRAFALAATAIGGRAWEGAGAVWYEVLTGDRIRADCDFATFAALTVAAAGARFGDGGDQQRAVERAWRAVGVLSDSSPAATPAGRPAVGPAPGSVVPAETDLTVARTGGLAGTRAERTVRLGELPGADAEHWWRLLTTPELAEAAATPRRPDAFSYRVASRSCGVDLTVPEHGLDGAARALFRRCLEG